MALLFKILAAGALPAHLSNWAPGFEGPASVLALPDCDKSKDGSSAPIQLLHHDHCVLCSPSGSVGAYELAILIWTSLPFLHFGRWAALFHNDGPELSAFAHSRNKSLPARASPAA